MVAPHIAPRLKGAPNSLCKLSKDLLLRKIFRGNYKSTHIDTVITNDPCELAKNSVNYNKPNLS